jgi:hypothetical protein
MQWIRQLSGSTVAIDTAPFIYFIERHPIYLTANPNQPTAFVLVFPSLVPRPCSLFPALPPHRHQHLSRSHNLPHMPLRMIRHMNQRPAN